MFVRHGEAQNALMTLEELISKGIAPHASQLTPRGKKQMQKTREVLAEKMPAGFTQYATSPYTRAVQSMQILAGEAVKFRLDPKMRELEQGVWATMRGKDLEQVYPGEEVRRRLGGYFYRPPGGESWPDLEMRVELVLERLCAEPPGSRILVVTHGYWCLALERVLFQRSIEQHMHTVQRREFLPHGGIVAFHLAGRYSRPKVSFSWESPD